MKICMPVENNTGGREAAISLHFGSAPYYAIIDDAAGEIRFTENSGSGHGSCRSAAFLQEEEVDTVITTGIGKGAVLALEQAGIKVYLAEGKTVRQALELFTQGKLSLIKVSSCCGGHHGNSEVHGGCCGHH